VKHSFGQFNEETYSLFLEMAQEVYSFGTCQRPDGSYYGSPGRCVKGSDAALPKKEKAEKTQGGGGRPAGEAAAQAENDAKLKRFEEGGRRGMVREFKKNAEIADKIRTSSGSSDMTVTNDENGIYIEQKVAGKSVRTAIERGRNGELQVAYEIDGSYDAGKVTDRGEQIKVARAAHRQFQESVKGMPDGTEVAVYAHKDDGNGAAREKAYKKLGFADADGDGLMMATLNGGVLDSSDYAESERDMVKVWTKIIFGK
jgi:hypothetical protein